MNDDELKEKINELINSIDRVSEALNKQNIAMERLIETLKWLK